MRTHSPAEGRAKAAAPADAAIESLRCRDDILQAMYWLLGEGFGTDTDAAGLARLIGIDAALVRDQLAVLEDQGSVDRADERYRLSATGQREGGRRFADEFADLQLTAHGECAPDCPHCEALERGDGCTHCVTGLTPDQAWVQ